MNGEVVGSVVGVWSQKLLWMLQWNNVLLCVKPATTKGMVWRDVVNPHMVVTLVPVFHTLFGAMQV